MKKKKTKPKKETKEVEAEVRPANFDNEKKAFDFGGLPDVNFKKNLGCG